jgi:hypothetical protein
LNVDLTGIVRETGKRGLVEASLVERILVVEMVDLIGILVTEGVRDGKRGVGISSVGETAEVSGLIT